MDEMTPLSKPKQTPTLIRFYDWVKQFVDHALLSEASKNHQIIGKKWEEKPDDIDHTF